MTYLPKMSISTLKLQFLNTRISQFSKSDYCPEINFFPKSKLGGYHTYVTGIYAKPKHKSQGRFLNGTRKTTGGGKFRPPPSRYK